MNDRPTKTVLILVVVLVAIPWTFLMVILSGPKVLFIIPVVAFFLLISVVLLNYFIFRRCKNLVERQGGAILSHNTTYSNLCISSGGIKMEVSITLLGRPSCISFTTVLEKEGYPTFCLRTSDCFNKMVRKLENKLNIDLEDNLVLDRKFVVTENIIPSILIDHLLLPIKEDLLQSLKAASAIKAYPAIDLYCKTLTIIFQDYYPNDLRLERYLRIVHGIVDSLNQSVTEQKQLHTK